MAVAIPPNTISFNAAMSACGASNGKLLALLDRMADSGAPPSVVSYNTAIRACEWPRDGACT